jgi:hypothetical protein
MAKKQISVSLRKPPPPADLEKLVVEAVSAPKSERTPKKATSQASNATTDVSGLASATPANSMPVMPPSMPVEEFVAKAKPGFCTITIDLPEVVADRLAQFCAQSGRDVHDVVAEILAKHFTEQLKTVVEPGDASKGDISTVDAIVAWVRTRLRMAGAMRERFMRLGQMAWASL